MIKKNVYNEGLILLLKIYYRSRSHIKRLYNETPPRRNFRICLERMKGKSYREIGTKMNLHPATVRLNLLKIDYIMEKFESSDAVKRLKYMIVGINKDIQFI